MTLSELKEFMLDLVVECFPAACVLWAEQYNAMHPLPQVTLKLKDMSTPRHPVHKVKEGIISAYYECTKILEVNLYTNSVSGGDGEIVVLDNPAVDELAMFLLFLQSEVGIDRVYAANICIEGMGPVRDLSELDRTHYRYRAMQEYTVRFMLEYKEGSASVHVPFAEEGWEPVREPIGYFEEVEIETEDIYE